MSQNGLADLPLDQLTNPVTGEPGARVRFLDEAGAELFAEDRLKTAPWSGSAATPRSAESRVGRADAPATRRPSSGTVRLGFAMVGRGRVCVDGELLSTRTPTAVGDDLGAAFLTPPTRRRRSTLVAGTPVDLRFQIDLRSPRGLRWPARCRSSSAPSRTPSDHDALIAEAAAAAATADVAVVVVGTNSMVESEGFDRDDARPARAGRTTWSAAVAAANPRTVVHRQRRRRPC